jgi:membrane protease subunit HflC
MKTSLNLWASALIIVVALLANACTVIVHEGTMVLHQRFGKIIASHTTPGLQVKWPWPIDQVEIFERKQVLFQGKDEQVLTKDQNSIIVSNHIIWSISPDALIKFKERINSSDRFEEQLEARLRSLRNGLFGESNFAQLFGDKTGLKPLEDHLHQSLTQSCLEDFGVIIHNVGFSHLGLAPTVLEAVYEKMNAERQRISSQLQSEGESISSKIKAEAQAKVDQEMAKIDGEVQEILGQAEADSLDAYRQLSEHRDLAIQLKKLQSLEKLLEGRSTIVLDRNTSPLDLFKKP